VHQLNFAKINITATTLTQKNLKEALFFEDFVIIVVCVLRASTYCMNIEEVLLSYDMSVNISLQTLLFVMSIFQTDGVWDLIEIVSSLLTL